MSGLIVQNKHILILIALLTLACSNTHDIAPRDNKQHGESELLKVVSTISPITSIVENIGGLKIQVGSQMIDSSIKNQLQTLKEKMKEVA